MKTRNHIEYTAISKLLREKIKEDYNNYKQNKQREVITAKCSLKKLNKEINMKHNK